MTDRQAQAGFLMQLIERLGFTCCVYHDRLVVWPPCGELSEEMRSSVEELEPELIGMTKALVITKWKSAPKRGKSK